MNITTEWLERELAKARLNAQAAIAAADLLAQLVEWSKKPEPEQSPKEAAQAAAVAGIQDQIRAEDARNAAAVHSALRPEEQQELSAKALARVKEQVPSDAKIQERMEGFRAFWDSGDGANAMRNMAEFDVRGVRTFPK
jgi:hypothetical protein